MVNKTVHVFNKTMNNIISNFIPDETMNHKVKCPIQRKNNSYKNYSRNNKNGQSLEKFQFLQNELNSVIKNYKQEYYSRISNKLMDPNTSSKSCWSIFKTFLDNKKISSLIRGENQ